MNDPERDTNMNTSRTTEILYMIGGAVIGYLVGGLLSYWFQPGLLRMAVSPVDYFNHIFPLLLTGRGTDPQGRQLLELLPTAYWTAAICAAVGVFVGRYVFQRSTSGVRAANKA